MSLLSIDLKALLIPKNSVPYLTFFFLLIPAVSTIFQICESFSISVSIESVVVPLISLTIALFFPQIEFNKLDLPTFGLPIIDIIILSASYSILRFSGSSSITRSSKSPVPDP